MVVEDLHLMVEKFPVIEQVPVCAPRIKAFLKREASSEKKRYRHDSTHLLHFSSAEINFRISNQEMVSNRLPVKGY